MIVVIKDQAVLLVVLSLDTVLSWTTVLSNALLCTVAQIVAMMYAPKIVMSIRSKEVV